MIATVVSTFFVANYLDFTVKGNRQCFASTGERDYCTPRMYQPAPTRLFHNRGDGTFEDVTSTAGIGAAIGPGLALFVPTSMAMAGPIFMLRTTEPRRISG